MEPNNDVDTTGAWSAVIIVGAMLVGALASELLDGIPQALVLAACLATMGRGVTVDLLRRFSGKQRIPARFADVRLETIEATAVARHSDVTQQAMEILRPVERSAQPYGM